jgi:hypothetical protein
MVFSKIFILPLGANVTPSTRRFESGSVFNAIEKTLGRKNFHLHPVPEKNGVEKGYLGQNYPSRTILGLKTGQVIKVQSFVLWPGGRPVAEPRGK